MAQARKRILPTGHHHLVFSIPQKYTSEWLRDQRSIISRLFRSVDRALKDWTDEIGLKAGWLLVFQSHGRGLSYKPHIHCLLSDGGLDGQGVWKTLGVVPLGRLAKALSEYFQDGDELFDPQSKEGWSVHGTVHEGSGDRVIGYLGQSMAGVVMALERGWEHDAESAVVRFEDLHGRSPLMTSLKETTFLERYLAHIPPRRAVTVRYYGIYANRHRQDFELAMSQMHRTENRSEAKAEELLVENCPCCHRPMHTIRIVEPGEVVDFRKYGYTKGPPEHGHYVTNLGLEVPITDK
jgi:hypothetical protein